MTTDPFAAPASEFTTLDDLALVENAADLKVAPGRLALFYPSSIQVDIPSDNGGTFNALFGKLVVLDGKPLGKVDQVPFVVEDFRLTGGFMVPGITALFTAGQPVIGGRAGEYTLIPKNPAVTMALGRFSKIKNKNNTGSWKLEAATDEDKVLARKYIADNPAPAPTDPFA